MDTCVSIRVADVADDAALLAIDRLTWMTHSSPAPVPDWSVRTAFFSADRGPDGFLVAELGGCVVGYVGLHQDAALPSHRHVLTIDGLGVDPAARARGVGAALVTAAVDRARVLGAAKVGLRVLAPNVVARRLYERCGFVEEGVLRAEFVVDGRPVDDVLMAHDLRS